MNTKHWIRYSLAFAALIITTSSLSAKEIVIAQVAPFGGPQAVSGRDFNLGALVAFEEFNSNGGLRGNTIRFISRDDGYRPADTLAHVKELLEKENPVAFLGMWGAENVEAVLSKGLLDQSGAPVIGVRSGASSLRDNPLLFLSEPATVMKCDASTAKLKPWVRRASLWCTKTKVLGRMHCKKYRN
jgi:ABC-type branched-subunit amino acid transport system substrate-binding protein